MTPTLLGRWETRIFVLATLGVIVTAIFAIADGNAVYWRVLAAVAIFGVAWDVAWILLQKLRWDRDWPAAFQVATGIVEGAFVLLLLRATGLPGIEEDSVPVSRFIAHYTTVWVVTFAWVQGPMRALFPRWRFYGGRYV